MSDVIDRGCEIEQHMRDVAIKRHLNRVKTAVNDGFCMDCGDEIHPERVRLINAVRCVSCQQTFEKREKNA